MPIKTVIYSSSKDVLIVMNFVIAKHTLTVIRIFPNRLDGGFFDFRIFDSGSREESKIIKSKKVVVKRGEKKCALHTATGYWKPSP